MATTKKPERSVSQQATRRLGHRVRKILRERIKPGRPVLSQWYIRPWPDYIELILIADQADDRDCLALAYLIADYGILPEQFHRDMELIAEADQKASWHDQLQAAQDAVEQARTAHKAAVAKERDTRRALHDAKRFALRCEKASATLRTLARERPDFFQPSDPPRLRRS